MMEEIVPDKDKGGEQEVLWNSPDITDPTTTNVLPGFHIRAVTGGGTVPTEWNLQIFQNGYMIKDEKQGHAAGLFYTVPRDLIAVGNFWFRVDYYIFPLWSRWEDSGNKIMGLDKPVITNPTNGMVVSRFPRVSGTGRPGATVRVYEAGSGAIVHATATVGSNGQWDTNVTQPLRVGSFGLTANQTVGNISSDWSTTVQVTVIYVEPPRIIVPYGGSVLPTHFPVVSGLGTPGATVYMHKARSDEELIHGSGTVGDDGKWGFKVTEPIPSGNPMYLKANQVLDGKTSDFSPDVEFSVR